MCMYVSVYAYISISTFVCIWISALGFISKLEGLCTHRNYASRGVEAAPLIFDIIAGPMDDDDSLVICSMAWGRTKCNQKRMEQCYGMLLAASRNGPAIRRVCQIGGDCQPTSSGNIILELHTKLFAHFCTATFWILSYNFDDL